MFKKFLIGLAPLLALAAFAIAPAAAQAEPHWYTCEHAAIKGRGKYKDPGCAEEKAKSEYELTRLPFESGGKATTVPVSMYGIVDFENGDVGTFTCHVIGEGSIGNSLLAVAGQGAVSLFDFSACVTSPTACPGLTVTALKEGNPLSATKSA